MIEWLKSFALRIKTLMRRRQLEADLDDELAFHKAMRESNRTAEGTRRFGNVTRLKEQCREQWTFSLVESILADVRYALRRVGKAPAFSVITILIMGLGIGANAAIFSLIDAVMLRSLPVRQPEELVHVRLTDSPYQVLPVTFWEALRDRADIFSSVFAWSQQSFNLERGGQKRNVDGLFVSGDYFTALGVGPAVGRILTANDDVRGCPGAAVLSYGFWQSRFGRDPNTVGQVITLNGYPVQVVGISAEGFFGVVAGNKFDVAIPICAEAVARGVGGFWVRMMGRLKPGLNADEGNARLASLTPSLFATLPTDVLGPSTREMRLGAFPSANGLSGSGIRNTYGRSLQTMMIVVGVVLLIACLNIACLLLARATARNREVAVRLALGASRWRLVRQLLTECLLLSLAGALLGLFLARWGFPLLVGFISTPLYSNGVPRISLDFSLDWRILGFTACVAMLATILFAVVPSILSTRTSLIWAMKGQRAEEAEHRRVFRPARWIVAVEVALSLVLLVVSGLFLKSFWKLATLDAGFDARKVLLVKVDLNTAKVPEPQQPAMREEILARLRALPGVTSASRSLNTPISGTMYMAPIDSHLPNAPTARDAAAFNFVSPGFFATLGTPLLAGRDFTEGDTAHTQPVSIINQTAARRLFQEDNPVGKYYSSESPLFGKQQREFLVIGVVKDAKFAFLREDFRATAYYPAAQMMPFAADWTFEIRTALRPSVVEGTTADAIASVNGAVSFQFSTLEQQVNNSIGQERLLAALSGFFGGLAVLLATIGVYGVLSYTVAQKKKEIGIRMALGAERRTILRLVLRDFGVVLFVGCCAGVLLALATTKLLATLLFGIQPHDLPTLALCVTLLATTGLIAAYLPARRASRLDPMPVLREE